MRRARTILAGLLAAALAVSCSDLCSTSSVLVAGTYGGDPSKKSAEFPYDTYRLTLSTDRTAVIEDFTLGGHAYHFEYAVTALDRP